MAQQNSNLYRFEKIIVLYNPASTNSKRSRSRINDLRELFPAKDIEVVETSPDGEAANKKIISSIAKDFDSTTLICLASGDGTVSIFLDSLLMDESIAAKAREVTVLPLWGGNANDLAHMVNGYSVFTSTKKIFEKSRIMPIYPIKIKMQNNGITRHKTAACYASFGVSAFAGMNMETLIKRNRKIFLLPGSRRLAELLVALYSIFKTKPYRAEINGVQRRGIYEHVFVNGSRWATVERMPVNLKDQEFFEVILDKKPEIILTIIKVLRNRNYGQIVKGSVSFTTKSRVLAQFDGEIEMIEPNTQVTAILSKKPFYVLTIKL